MLSLRTHNIIDYVAAAVLILCPFVFGFADTLAARNIFLVAGVGLAIYSALTKYYYTLARVIPLGVHMTMDAAAGVVLILAPFIWGYRDILTPFQYGVHIVAGLAPIGLVILTRTRSEAAKTPEEVRETTGPMQQVHARA